MKKKGLLHGALSKVIAQLAHDDTILIGDAGMPCPDGVEFIDLALTKGIPGFLEVLQAVMQEMLVAECFIDVEQRQVSPAMNEKLLKIIGDSFPISIITHEETKLMARNCKAVVRTGEFTPYANIVLKAGCLF